MDEMKIQSKFLTGLFSKIITKNVKKKIGVDCDVLINGIVFKNDGNKTTIKLNIEAGIETSKVPEVLNKFGIL